MNENRGTSSFYLSAAPLAMVFSYAKVSEKRSASGFYLFGASLAMVLSYNKWHKIEWAIFHGIFSWFYVIYFWIRQD